MKSTKKIKDETDEVFNKIKDEFGNAESLEADAKKWRELVIVIQTFVQ